MKISIKKGLGFGLASGVITTLGLIIGLNSSTESTVVVISGIFIIAVADAMSDALGMHISEEAECKHTHLEIWESTIATFSSKFIFALTFVIPMIFFNLKTAVLLDVCWGYLLIILFSLYMAKRQGVKPIGVVGEHVLIATIVIVITNYVGKLALFFADKCIR